ncbi:adenosine receptor A1-like [Oculina patagonica]
MNSSSNHSLPTWEMWIWSTSFVVESIAIVFANSLTFHIFLNQRKNLRQTSFLIINLALADLFVGLSTGCFAVENLILSYTGERPTATGCLTVDVLSECASMSFLVVVSLERMHAVFWPLRHRITGTRSYIYVICTAWIFSVISTIMFIISHIGILDKSISTSIFVFLMAVLPLTVCVVYCRIWFRIKRLRKESIRKHRNMANNKLTKTLFIASILSVVTWLPLCATLLARIFCKNCLSSKNSNRIIYVARIFQYRNSLLNPIVYSLRLPEFRGKLLELLCRHQTGTSVKPASLISETSTNFALQSTTPILLSLTPLTSSTGQINNSNHEHEK